MSDKVAAALHPATTIDFQPGVYDMPDDTYHADPVPGGSLSVSGAKLLLPPNCPALFDHERRNPRKPKDIYDFGHAAHLEVLGAGAAIAPVDADDWRSKAAREAKDEAHRAGLIPMLAKDVDTVRAMGAAIRNHALAMALFSNGKPEQSLFAPDPDTGVMRRGRLDWLPNPTAGRMIIADYKTTNSASPDKCERALADYGYHQQAAWYTDLATDLHLAEEVRFVFVFQEKTAPYLVSVFEPNPTAVRIGRYLNHQAIDIYKRCTATGHWPAYTDGVEQLALPVYYERKFEDVA